MPSAPSRHRPRYDLGAMGKENEIHDAKHQRQPGGNQEQHHPGLKTVENLFQKKGRCHTLRNFPGPEITSP